MSNQAPVDQQVAAGLEIGDVREALEVADRVADRDALETGLAFLLRHQPVIGELGCDRFEQVEPFADEIALGQRLEVRGQRRGDATARGMSHDDDMLDLQHLNRELDARRGAVLAAARLEGRHEIGDVAQHEQFARPAIENRFGGRPAVATGDDHGRGRLPFGRELVIAVVLGGVAPAHEIPVTVDEVLGKCAHENRLARAGGARNLSAASAPGQCRTFAPRPNPATNAQS